MISDISELLSGHAKSGMIIVVVTHNLGFARKVSHRFCFCGEGRIIESGTPEAMLERPKSPRLVDFLSAVQDTPF